MADIVLPQPVNVLGPLLQSQQSLNQVRQLDQGQQRLDLLQQNLLQDTQKLEAQRVGDNIKRQMSILKTPGQSDAFYQSALDGLGELGAIPRGLQFNQVGKDLTKRLVGIERAVIKDSGFDLTGALQSVREEFSTVRDLEEKIGITLGAITRGQEEQARRAIALLGTLSGGRSPNLPPAGAGPRIPSINQQRSLLGLDQLPEPGSSQALQQRTEQLRNVARFDPSPFRQKAAKEALAFEKGLEEKTEKAVSPLGKLQADRQRLIDEGTSEDSEIIKAFDREIDKAGKETQKTTLTPSQAVTALNAKRDDARRVVNQQFGEQTVTGGFVIDPDKFSESQQALVFIDDFIEKNSAETTGVLAAVKATIGAVTFNGVLKIINQLRSQKKTDKQIGKLLKDQIKTEKALPEQSRRLNFDEKNVEFLLRVK